jgi:ARG and Rhodanese-Phosphatase-superfamily-associated Protein domain
MTTKTESTPPAQSLSDFLSEPLRVGEPDVVGALAVFPLFAPTPHLEYLAFAQARAKGFRVGELEGGASVNDLLIENPTGDAVLLFEGEEVLGAQQNRVFDVSVLVAAGAKLRVPVSCVEAGRWQGSRHREAFRPARQTAYPRLRRAKARQVREQVAVGGETRADQSAVWSAIHERAHDAGTVSPTGAMNDIYEQRRSRLDEITERTRLREGQSGALVAIDGRFVVLDLVSRADAFAALHGPLVQGYGLDALEAETTDEVEPPAQETARGFTLLVADCEPAHRKPGVGVGEELRFAANGIAGTALVHDGELIHLTAFPEDGADPDEPNPSRAALRAGRVRRPSRRR